VVFEAAQPDRYEALILDADNTLFDFDRAEAGALRQALQAFGYRGFSRQLYSSYHAINEQLWRLFERGAISQQELQTERFRRLLKLLPRRPNGPAPENEISARYIEALSEKGYLLPHARGVLRSLSAKVPLILLSNGIARVQRGRIARSGIGSYFKDILISTETGLAKPDPAIFTLAIEKLGRPAQRILCVGDNPSSDIRGAHAAKLDTCWFAPPRAEYPQGEPQPTYRISDLRQLRRFVPAADG
jgi:YjjG family noncanonical pyrimidine nucleotidase